jgi:hypothetical protein
LFFQDPFHINIIKWKKIGRHKQVKMNMLRQQEGRRISEWLEIATTSRRCGVYYIKLICPFTGSSSTLLQLYTCKDAGEENMSGEFLL